MLSVKLTIDGLTWWVSVQSKESYLTSDHLDYWCTIWLSWCLTELACDHVSEAIKRILGPDGWLAVLVCWCVLISNQSTHSVPVPSHCPLTVEVMSTEVMSSGTWGCHSTYLSLTRGQQGLCGHWHMGPACSNLKALCTWSILPWLFCDSKICTLLFWASIIAGLKSIPVT